MNNLIYLDTNIYLDYLEDRTDNIRPLGEFAFQLIKRTIACEFKIVISGLVFKELANNIDENRVKELFAELNDLDKLIEIEAIEEDVNKTVRICKERKTDFEDTLHAVIANRLKVDYLVTRNIEHFSQLSDLVSVVFPEFL
jgi:predicted nucleic acid-binding protein